MYIHTHIYIIYIIYILIISYLKYKSMSQIICLLRINIKYLKKEQKKYVTIHIYDREVIGNESVIYSMLLSATMTHRSMSVILLTFEDVLVPRKHTSILRIKAKFSLAFFHVLILFLGSFLLLRKLSAVCEEKRLHSLLTPPKHEKGSGVNDLCSTGRICWLYTPISFRLHSFYEQLEDYGVNGICRPQKTVCRLMHNPLADTSALTWLLVFEDLGNSTPVNGVSNGSIITFLQPLPSISAVRILISLCRVTTNPPFEQDKACCKLNESPQTQTVLVSVPDGYHI